MTRKQIIAALGALLVIAATLWIFWPGPFESHGEDDHAEDGHNDEAASPEGIVQIDDQQIEASEIEIETVGRGAAIELVFPATVVVAPNAGARVDARASGVVQSINKNLGDFVRRGEPLARIESGDAALLASQLATARARVAELSSAYERELRLFEANVTARQDLEAARANLQVAQAELSRAQSAVAAAGVSRDGRSLTVTSPISGRITDAPIILGSYVSNGDELFEVVNGNDLQVQVSIPAADAARINPGDEAALILGQAREIGGRVRSVTPSLDSESRSATAIITLSPSPRELRPGAFLQARIRPSGETDPNAISVADTAVQIIDGREVIFVRTAGGFQAMPVVTAERSGGRVRVLSGLQAGQQIATGNAFLLKAELGKEEAEHGH